MKESNLNIIPVLLGADQNCYNVARAFHEAYGLVSYALGRYEIGITQRTKIVKFRAVENLNTDDVFMMAMDDFAKRHEGSTLIALGCTDEYAALLIRHRAELEDRYIIPYIDEPLMNKLADKADFYEMCAHYGIKYPKTVVLDAPAAAEALTSEKLGFAYPIIVKPSSSIDYWHHPFDGMKKVYVSQSAEETEKIVQTIYDSGYTKRMLLQDRVVGSDANMRVLTAYVGKDHKVKMMCLGHVLLEEHTPKGLGNHAAIITEYNPELTAGFRAMLEDIGYRGFANFDIKYDSRDGSLYAFEINLRQGRSNYYVTASGFNIAEYLVKDYVLCSPLAYAEAKEPCFWHYVPRGVVYRYASRSAANEARALVRQGKEASSLWYRYDVCRNPLRALYLFIHGRRYYKKYKTYCPKQD